MLIWTAKLSKKKLLLPVILLAAVILCVMLWRGTPEEPAEQPLQLLTNEERIAWLGNWGWQVEPEPLETLQFLLPDPLEEPYLSYARLQADQGLYFTSGAGQRVTRYTYAVTNYPGHTGVQVNLYLCEKTPIGGDIFCAGANGFQSGLTFPNAAE